MKIKKEIKLIILLFFIILLMPFINKIFVKRYNIIYEKNKYIVNEIYKYENKMHNYEINIKNKEYEITYLLNEKFNKNKKIIEDIKVYKEEDIICLLPIYIKDTNLNLYCLKDDKQVSAYYLKDNKAYKKILNKTKKYQLNNPKSNNSTKKVKNMNIYYNNISEEDIFTIWDYKGINIIQKDKNSYVKILNYDLYENIKSIIYDDYFVLFENSKVEGIKNIYYYDLIKDKLKVYNPDIILSKDFYINGVVDKLIYVTDNKAKKEYTINLRKKEIEQINKANEYIVYKNNKIKSLTKSDYFLDEQLFFNKKEINKKISNSEIINENNIYYYLEGNNFYRKIKNRKEELLFSLDNIKEWKVINKNILLISDDTVYLYKDSSGLKPIIQSNELKYNYKNIVDYKEKK